MNTNLIENSELKKYLESYKRFFFRKQLDNAKSILILDKKCESLGLDKEEVKQAEVSLHKNLLEAIDFISTIMDLNKSLDISEDAIEIEEYCKDLGFTKDEMDLCIDFARNSSKEDVENYKAKIIEDKVEKKIIEEVITFENNDESEFENIKVKKELEGEDKKISSENSKSSDYVPSFKERAKEIINIDSSEDEEHETITTEEAQMENIEIINLEVVDLDNKEATLEIIGEAKEELNDKLFNDFDEEIKVEEEISEEAEPTYESTSFIRYDEEDMLSKENSLDEILDLESREFRLETLKTLFYNGCLICVDRFKSNIFSIRGRRNFTKETIRSAFYDGYEELINYTHSFLTKEGINDDSIDKEKLFERIFGLQCFETLSKQINKVNIMLDNSVSEVQILNSIERSIGIYKANSDKPHFKTYAVRSITRDIKEIFENAKVEYNLRDNIEQGILKLILEAVEFINKCGLANFDIYTEDHGRTINNLLECKAEAKEILGKYEDGKGIVTSEYRELLKNSIVAYPFFEDTYVALAKVSESNLGEYNLLLSAFELLNKCGENATKIMEELKIVEVGLYTDEVKKIPTNTIEDVKVELCRENIENYNIKDNDIIFETEINHFGYVVSDIDVNLVSEEARIVVFKHELLQVKAENYDEELRKETIEIKKNKYFIRNWECLKVEYAVFGRSFEGEVFGDLDKTDRVNILDFCMKSIKEISGSGQEKRTLLLELQERDITNKKTFREIEKEIFGFVIPLTDEENIEFDFMEKINYIYNDCDAEIKALDIEIKNKKWDFKVPGFYKLVSDMQVEYEPIIMVYEEDAKNGEGKEGFVVTDRAIYSSYAKRFLKFSDIESLKVKNYSKVKKGERVFYDGIFVDVEHKDFKLCNNYMGSKDSFAQMLNKILDAYRTINGFEPLDRLENKAEENMLLGIDSENMLFGNKKLQDKLKVNLEENKYYELMSDILNYDNLTYGEILVELSKLINKEVFDKVYFSEITDGSGEKIREACSSYVMSISELEEIYLLVDNTKKFPLQFQKLGVVISSKGIYCKNRLEDAWMLDLKYASNIKAKEDNKIQITNRIIEFTHIKKKQDLYDLRDLIEFVIVLRQIMDNPLEEIDEEIGDKVNPRDAFTLDLVNSVKSEELRKMLFIHSEGVASEKKYAAAISSYADLEDSENPVVLLDTTVFGVKASGLLVTNKKIYYKEGMANSGLNINLLAISKVYIKNEKFYINGIELKLSGLKIKEKTELCEKLSELIDYLKGTGFKRV